MKVNATVTLACSHIVPFRNWPAALIPRLGDELWCYECRDTKQVVEIETEEPPSDGPSGKESEYGWSE